MSKVALAALKPSMTPSPRRSRPAPPPDLIRDDDFTPAGVAAVFDLAADVKKNPRRFQREPLRPQPGRPVRETLAAHAVDV